MSRGRILIVDDSKIQRDRMRDILRQAGYEVLVADDGLAGFEIAVKEKPHMVISDIHMPQLDGYGFCKALKEHGSTRSIPMVFLSTLDSVDDLMRGMEAGAADYLSKQTDGPDQVLQMAAVHTAHAKKLREKRRDDAVEPEELDGDEFQSVTELPISFFDGLSFGIAVANLRRKPIYLNHQARWALGYTEDDPLSDIAGPDFEEFLSNSARRYQDQLSAFFSAVQHKGKALNVHLEQVYSARKQICGVMVVIQTQQA